ncbi:hypothetical protein HNV12_16940 [Methanococcoides sp. SA1]|nr:hypothetical protein [Methanococcoides sp. SA1]
MGNKRGAVDWTVGKLINIVLLVVVLALVIYGMGQGGLNPLIDNFKERWDDTVYLVKSFGGKTVVSECHPSKVSELGGGDDLLRKLGISEADLDICNDGVCNFSSVDVRYRKNQGVFEKMDGQDWREYRATFSNPKINELHWGVYDLGVDLLESVGVRGLYDDGFTRELILTGDGAGNFDDPTVASWANGEWRVSRDGEELIVFSDSDQAIDWFVRGVDDVWDDKVYWKIVSARRPDEFGLVGSDLGRSVEELLERGGGNGEIDDDVEVLQLKGKIDELIEQFNNEVVLGEEVFVKLESLSGRSVSILEKDYVVEIENDNGVPILVFVSGAERIGLRYERIGKVNSDLEFWVGDSFGTVKMRYFPVSLVGWSGSHWSEMGDEDVYRLREVNFEEVFEASVVKSFLDSKCR